MIRSALIALGLTASGLGAGAAQAQGLVATAPILEACGGSRIVLQPQGDADADALARASDVVSARMGGLYSQIFDYTIVQDDSIIVSLPRAFDQDISPLVPLLEPVGFGFHEVYSWGAIDAEVTLTDDQVRLPDVMDDTAGYVVSAAPIMDGGLLKAAQPSFDMNGRPAVSFSFTDEGTAIFADYTANNIGKPFAIVLRGEVMSAPTIQSVIAGGEGIITGNFTVEETTTLAASMTGGLMPFAVDIVAIETMDGSDPSADFCP